MMVRDEHSFPSGLLFKKIDGLWAAISKSRDKNIAITNCISNQRKEGSKIDLPSTGGPGPINIWLTFSASNGSHSFSVLFTSKLGALISFNSSSSSHSSAQLLSGGRPFKGSLEVAPSFERRGFLIFNEYVACGFEVLTSGIDGRISFEFRATVVFPVSLDIMFTLSTFSISN